MSHSCNCCEGNETLTPRATTNRPGLDALKYRVGTHATFLETMKARLAGQPVEISLPSNPGQVELLYPLQNLTTREVDDPSIAFLDAWATVADVLTFYQERIANEGYLRTAIERRSLLELGRLVGYKPRPGVAASVYLAFTMERDFAGEVPKGARVQSIPGPGQLPQSFETSETIPTRAAWNVLKPRMSRPQNITNTTDAQDLPYIYFEGIDNNLQPGFPLLFVFDSDPNQTVVRWIEKVELDAVANRTRVTLQEEIVSAPPTTLPGGMSREFVAAAIGGPDWAERVRAVVEKYLDLGQFGISPGKMAGEVQSILEDLRGKIAPDTTPETVKTFLEEALLALREKHATAVEKGYGQLERWLGAMVQEFEAILTGLSQDSATNAGSTATDAQAGLEASTHHSGHLGNGDDENNGGEDDNGGDHGNEHEDEGNNGQETSPSSILDRLSSILEQLSKPPKEQVRSAPYLKQAVNQLFDQDADALLEVIQSFQPNLVSTLYSALQNLVTVSQENIKVYVLRVRAAPFGHNAPKKPLYSDGKFTGEYGEWDLIYPKIIYSDRQDNRARMILPLDATYNDIVPNSWLIFTFDEAYSLEQGIEAKIEIIAQIEEVQTVSIAEYSIANSVTQLIFEFVLPKFQESIGPAIALAENGGGTLEIARHIRVYVQSEELTLANEPLEQAIGPSVEMKTEEEVDVPEIPGPSPELYFDQAGAAVSESDQTNGSEASSNIIELDGVYDGLKPGRWLIVTGQRADIIDDFDNVIAGVRAKELVMLAGVEQPAPEIPGDTPHTVLILDQPLAYSYKRDTVEIYANVVEATHGETKEEVLGSGDTSKAFQTFALGKSPLTHVAAPTAAGVESTLTVRVNDVRWREADNLAELDSEDRRFITRTSNEGITSVIFGNGERGKRLPTGIENVKALYRFGIGQGGNVAGEQIKLVAGRPLGVKGVINPLPASGGADPEGPNQIRRNAPLAFKALDRLVSAQDYADFAQTFAGIDKAHALSRSNGQQETIYVTVTGLNDTPIDKTAQLYRNLIRALKQHGDPQQSFQVLVRDLVIVVISAEVKIDPDYLWEAVEPQIRTALLDTFSFENRALGQDVLLSEVISIVQKIPGVIYVDVNAFGGIPELKDSRGVLDIDKIVEAIAKLIQTSQSNIYMTARIPVNLTSIGQPAQIAYLKPEIPQTLILNNLGGE